MHTHTHKHTHMHMHAHTHTHMHTHTLPYILWSRPVFVPVVSPPGEGVVNLSLTTAAIGVVGRSVVASGVEVTATWCVGLEVVVVEVVWASGRVVMAAVCVNECKVHEWIGCIERNWLSNYPVTQEATIASGKNGVCTGTGVYVLTHQEASLGQIGIHFPSLPLASGVLCSVRAVAHYYDMAG